MTFVLHEFLPLQSQSLDWLHAGMESLACFLGYRYYVRLRRQEGDAIPSNKRQFIIFGAALGAVVGSRVPGFMEHSVALDPNLCLTQKTIVGGLLGAWLAVECTKLLVGEKQSSGDLFTPPLILAMIIGRIGCFLAGLGDATYGLPTTVSWAVDFGDGIPRHPTQLYEILFLLMMLLISRQRLWTRRRSGTLFRCFLASYLLFRFQIDFWKPLYRFTTWQLAATQWAALSGLFILLGLEGISYVRTRLHLLRYEHQHLLSMPEKSGSQSHLRE